MSSQPEPQEKCPCLGLGVWVDWNGSTRDPAYEVRYCNDHPLGVSAPPETVTIATTVDVHCTGGCGDIEVTHEQLAADKCPHCGRDLEVINDDDEDEQDDDVDEVALDAASSQLSDCLEAVAEIRALLWPAPGTRPLPDVLLVRAVRASMAFLAPAATQAPQPEVPGGT